MTNTGKRKVELPILASEIPAMLHQLGEQAEKGMLSLGGKEIAVDAYDTFSVSFRQTKVGMRMRVKVKYGKSEQDGEDDAED